MMVVMVMMALATNPPLCGTVVQSAMLSDDKASLPYVVLLVMGQGGAVEA